MRKTGYVFEEHFLWHDPGSLSFDHKTQPGLHWEHAETKQRIHSLICVSGAIDSLVRLKARQASKSELCLFHEQGYVDRIVELSNDRGGEAGDMATFSHGGFEIAALAVGGVLTAIDAVMDGTVQNCYCLVRPPGHHAESNYGMGFCIFNNVVVGAKYAQQKHGLKKVAVIDFDVHHGNGSESAFKNDPDVLFISIHQDNNYPVGRGEILKGFETTINVPLPPGSGIGAYRSTFERIVVPAIDRFKPELILVSSGFDASFCDPLGSMMCTSDCFREMAADLISSADRHCDGKIVFCHEGGYSREYVPFCGLAVVESMLGKRFESWSDPMLEEAKSRGYQELQPHQTALIEKVLEACSLQE